MLTIASLPPPPPQEVEHNGQVKELFKKQRELAKTLTDKLNDKNVLVRAHLADLLLLPSR